MINHLLIQRARAGKVVVSLKGGDPFVLERVGEEAEALAENHISFEVVPGVSSAVAVPPYFMAINLLFYGKNMNGMLKAIADADSRKYLGFHHLGDGAKVSFQYLPFF
jgi:siroheme synthase